MELKLDAEKFEQLQVAFIEEIVKEINIKVQEAGLEGRELEDLTGRIALSIASIIDGTSGVEVDGVDVRPYLAFGEGDDELVHCGENAYTYEFVRPLLTKLYDS